MTNLPALATTRVITQDEARAFASSWIAKFNAGPNLWSPGSLLSPDAGQGFVRDMLRRIVSFGDPRMRMQVIAAAGAGDPDAVEVLRALLLEYKSRGIGLPTELAAYDMDITAGNVRPQLRPGGKKRSWCATSASAWVARGDRFGIDPTGRSRTAGARSSARHGGRMASGEAAEKIWGLPRMRRCPAGRPLLLKFPTIIQDHPLLKFV